MQIIVIGAIAGGSTAASQIRRALPDANITLIGSDRSIGYGTCGMPFVIGGIIEDANLIKGPSPENFSTTKNIETLTQHQVLSIDRQYQQVEVENLQTKERFHLPYDKLVLSTGTRSRIPSYEGLETIPFFTLKHLEDMEAIQDFIRKYQPTSCAIVGGGFIGIELAENLIHLGLETTVILRGDHVMSSMDPKMSTRLMDEMKSNGVQFILNTEISQVSNHTLTMQNGTTITVDFLLASIGTIPNTELASDAGLSLGVTKGVPVNAYMQTADSNIYAIGDIAETEHFILQQPTRIELAWHAHRAASIVAEHLKGNSTPITPFLGTTITKLFSLSAAMTGCSEKELQRAGRIYKTVEHTGRTNAGYYPDHGMIDIRVHYDPVSRNILGAQAVGTKGVDKRIDVLATAIIGGLTIDQLAGLELSYSPPYSSPKDPLNMVGYKAD